MTVVEIALLACFINYHCGNEYVGIKAYVATSLTVVVEIFTSQHIQKTK